MTFKGELSLPCLALGIEGQVQQLVGWNQCEGSGGTTSAFRKSSPSSSYD